MAIRTKGVDPARSWRRWRDGSTAGCGRSRRRVVLLLLLHGLLVILLLLLLILLLLILRLCGLLLLDGLLHCGSQMAKRQTVESSES